MSLEVIQPTRRSRLWVFCVFMGLYSYQSSSENDQLAGICEGEVKQPVTIAMAKKIMGASAKNLSDEEIEELIINLTAIARTYIKAVPKY